MLIVKYSKNMSVVLQNSPFLYDHCLIPPPLFFVYSCMNDEEYARGREICKSVCCLFNHNDSYHPLEKKKKKPIIKFISKDLM